MRATFKRTRTHNVKYLRERDQHEYYSRCVEIERLVNVCNGLALQGRERAADQLFSLIWLKVQVLNQEAAAAFKKAA